MNAPRPRLVETTRTVPTPSLATRARVSSATREILLPDARVRNDVICHHCLEKILKDGACLFGDHHSVNEFVSFANKANKALLK